MTVSIVLFSAFLLQVSFSSSRTAIENRRSTTFGNNLQEKLLYNFILLTTICLIGFLLCIFISNQHKLEKLNIFVVGFPLFGILLVIPVLLKLFQIDFLAKIYMDIFRIGFMDIEFADLRIILTGIGCSSVNGVGDAITCAPSDGNPAWIYPSMLLRLRPLGINEDKTILLAILFLAVFMMCVFFFFRNAHLVNILATIIFISSPAMFLLIERMNLDLIILTLLLFASMSYFSSRGFLQFFALLFLASLWKYYAIFSNVIIFFLNISRRQIAIFFAVFIPVCTILTMDVLGAQTNFPGDTIGSFGWRNTICMYSGCEDVRQSNLLLSLLVFIVLICILYMVLTSLQLFRKNYLDNLIMNYEYRKNLLFFLISAPVSLCYWILTSNYWYRLTISLFCIIALNSFMKRSTYLVFVVFTNILCAFFPMGTFANVTNLFFTLMHLTIFFYFALFIRERQTIRLILSKQDNAFENKTVML